LQAYPNGKTGGTSNITAAKAYTHSQPLWKIVNDDSDYKKPYSLHPAGWPFMAQDEMLVGQESVYEVKTECPQKDANANNINTISRP
jgi:hypothetical protein